MAYTHLALEERYHIYSLSVQSFGPTAIAAEVGRCQKKRRKRYVSAPNRRGCIPNRVEIEKRRYVVDLKMRVGDWEGDTVIGGLPTLPATGFSS